MNSIFNVEFVLLVFCFGSTRDLLSWTWILGLLVIIGTDLEPEILAWSSTGASLENGCSGTGLEARSVLDLETYEVSLGLRYTGGSLGALVQLQGVKTGLDPESAGVWGCRNHPGMLEYRYWPSPGQSGVLAWCEIDLKPGATEDGLGWVGLYPVSTGVSLGLKVLAW
jgi:hypothetical protein